MAFIINDKTPVSICDILSITEFEVIMVTDEVLEIKDKYGNHCQAYVNSSSNYIKSFITDRDTPIYIIYRMLLDIDFQIYDSDDTSYNYGVRTFNGKYFSEIRLPQVIGLNSYYVYRDEVYLYLNEVFAGYTSDFINWTNGLDFDFYYSFERDLKNGESFARSLGVRLK
jgi:hypothetical protein